MLKQVFSKWLCALAPLYFGLYYWFFQFGPGAYYNIGYAPIIISATLLVMWFYYDSLEYACHQYSMTLAGERLYLPSWKYLIIPTLFLLIGASYIYWPHNVVMQSLLYGVLVSAFSEELLARSVFVKYRMHFGEFLFFNVLNSVSFAFMHAGFEAVPAVWTDYIFVRGHFTFSFLLNCMIYKTNRIEITMIMHSLSNMMRYTIPVLVFGEGQLALMLQMSFMCVEYVVLAFSGKQSIQRSV